MDPVIYKSLLRFGFHPRRFLPDHAIGLNQSVRVNTITAILPIMETGSGLPTILFFYLVSSPHGHYDIVKLIFEVNLTFY